MKKLVTLLVLIALLVSVIPAGAAGGNTEGGQVKKFADNIYIVQMIDAPVVAYDGGIAGFPATAPKQGQKIDPLDAKVVKYVGYLKGKHDAAMQSVGATKKLYSYTYTYNGFSAEMTADQAAALRSKADVLTVTKNEWVTVDTSSTPTFLGLRDALGKWTFPATGEGVIIGVVDSGIWPENPSFTDRVRTGPQGQSGKLGYQQIPGWHGQCVPGEMFTASNCNQKLIGAQFFNESWGGNAGIEAQRPWEFTSAA